MIHKRHWVVLLMLIALVAQPQTIKNTKSISEKQYTKATQLFDSLFTGSNKRYKFWPEEALVRFKHAKQWAINKGDNQKTSYADFMILMYYDNQLRDDEVIRSFEKLAPQLPSLGSLERANIYQALYNSYERKGFFRQQLLILDSLNTANKDCNYCVRPSTYQNALDLAKIYYNLQQYNKAIKNYNIQYKAFEDAENYLRSASMLNNIALSYENQNQTDSAFHYYDLAYQKIDEKGHPDPYLNEDYRLHMKNIIASNMASLRLESALYLPAEAVFKAELASSKAVKEPRITLVTYAKLADFYVQKKDLQLARQYLDSAMTFEANYPNPRVKAKLYFTSYQLHRASQDFEKADQSLETYLSAIKELQKQKLQRAYLEATAKYKFEEAQKNLQRNKSLLLRKEKINTIQAVLLVALIIALVIIIVLLKKAQRSNLLINSQKEKLTKGLDEKQMLLNEMHHRTKNNLQIVSGILEIQSQKNINTEANKLLRESKNYLESIALIHQMLYDQDGFETIDAQQYLHKLINLFTDNYSKIELELDLSIEKIPLHINTATSLGLILSELIINSLKHAFEQTGTIQLSLCQQQDHLLMRYADDGNFKGKFLAQKDWRTGMQLIHSLADDLDASIEFSNKLGFEVKLKWKHHAA